MQTSLAQLSKMSASFHCHLNFLQLSERTDSHLDNLHVGLTLWDGVLQLGAEVESWTTNKLAVFAESPSFQTENAIKTLQVKLISCLFFCAGYNK